MTKLLINKLMELVNVTLEKESNNKIDIFFDYSGHINQFNIRVYKNGWEKSILWDVEYQIHLNDSDVITAIEQIKEEIQKL